VTKLGLFAMFAQLAEPPEPGTGAWQIHTDDGREGVVRMAGGRVCWASPDLGGRTGEPTGRTILSLVKSGIRACAWVPHEGADPAPEPTISVAQAACRCVALVKGRGAESLEASLEAMLAGDAAGLLIHLDSRLPFAASELPMTWQALRGWLTWTLRIASLCPLPSRGYATGRGPGGGWVVWRAGAMAGIAVTASDDAQRRVLLRVASTLADWTVEQPA
jgi:hypothetical protein